MCCRYYLLKTKLFFSVWSTAGKAESFCKATSKEVCFLLYLEKGKLFIKFFWPLSCTTVAKKNTFSVEFLLPWKKNLERSDVVKQDLRVTCYELLVTSWKLKSASWNSKVWFQISNFKFRFQMASSTLRVTSSNPGVASSNSWVQESFNQWKLT